MMQQYLNLCLAIFSLNQPNDPFKVTLIANSGSDLQDMIEVWSRYNQH